MISILPFELHSEAELKLLCSSFDLKENTWAWGLGDLRLVPSSSAHWQGDLTQALKTFWAWVYSFIQRRELENLWGCLSSDIQRLWSTAWLHLQGSDIQKVMGTRATTALLLGVYSLSLCFLRPHSACSRSCVWAGTDKSLTKTRYQHWVG